MIQIIYTEPTFNEYVADLAAIEFALKAMRHPSVAVIDSACAELARITRERDEVQRTIEALSYAPF